MKTIRSNVFETNSSSCHSITFPSYHTEVIPSDNFILEVKGDDFGFGPETISDPQGKFSYWFSAFVDCVPLLFREKLAAKNNKSVWESYPSEKSPLLPELFEEGLNEIYDHFAKVLIFFRDKGVNLLIKYDSNQHDLEDYLDTFRRNNDDYESHVKDQIWYFNFLVEERYGIDHQSGPAAESDCRRLGWSSPEEIFDFVFGDGEVELDNDNH